jgi:hypothetical protein
MPDPAPKTQTPPAYKKLPGRGSNFIERVSLYLAPDHLLYISSTGFSESYRRFYYRDIHSVSVRKTATGLWFNALTGMLLFLCLVGAFSADDAAGWIGWGIPAALCITLLLINIFRGPTCICDIHTAVQSRRLYSVNRLRRAARFLAMLRPLLLAAQGEVTLDELRLRIDAARQSAFANAAPPVIR